MKIIKSKFEKCFNLVQFGFINYNHQITKYPNVLLRNVFIRCRLVDLRKQIPNCEFEVDSTVMVICTRRQFYELIGWHLKRNNCLQTSYFAELIKLFNRIIFVKGSISISEKDLEDLMENEVHQMYEYGKIHCEKTSCWWIIIQSDEILDDDTDIILHDKDIKINSIKSKINYGNNLEILNEDEMKNINNDSILCEQEKSNDQVNNIQLEIEQNNFKNKPKTNKKKIAEINNKYYYFDSYIIENNQFRCDEYNQIKDKLKYENKGGYLSCINQKQLCPWLCEEKIYRVTKNGEDIGYVHYATILGRYVFERMLKISLLDNMANHDQLYFEDGDYMNYVFRGTNTNFTTIGMGIIIMKH